MTRYRGCRLPILTQHGKEELLAPVFLERLGAHVERVTGFDTDRLGTFTGEVSRAGSQLEAARRKAELAMQLGGGVLALASEGAFSPDPVSGFLPWNYELVLFQDDSAGLEVIGRAHGPAVSGRVVLHQEEQLRQLAERVGFPAQQLVMRPVAGDVLHKGLARWDALWSAFEQCRRMGQGGEVEVEPDLRAHANPTRQCVILRAAADLVDRLATLCPRCASPGFGRERDVSGRPCRDCGWPTRMPVGAIWVCPVCRHEEPRGLVDDTLADPSTCEQCNP